MRTNFEIQENFAVLYNGAHIDLHNNFDFIALVESPEKHEISLEFRKSDGEWVRPNEFARLRFLLKNVTYRYSEAAKDDRYPEDAGCLSEITFFPSGLREINDSFTFQQVPEATDDLLFFFQDGSMLRIHCEEAELIVVT